jgi:hypothetical protein
MNAAAGRCDVLERVLNGLRERIRANRYVLTTHADEEMDDEGLTIFDVEQCVLTGQIVERQKDQSTGEWKYRIRGRTVCNGTIEVVVKLGPTDKVVIITVYTP